MKFTNSDIKNVSENISNFIYKGNLQATRELMELLDSITLKPLKHGVNM